MLKHFSLIILVAALTPLASFASNLPTSPIPSSCVLPPDEKDIKPRKLSKAERAEAQAQARHEWGVEYARTKNHSHARLEELLKKRSQIIGLELVIVEPSKLFIQSRWGHVIFRFVDSDTDWGNDIIISFEPDVTDVKMNLLKGLRGGYRTMLLAKSTDEFWKHYASNQSRDMDRYIVPSSQEMRDELLNLLEDWHRNPGNIGRYTYIRRNCASMLERFLELANFPSQGFRFLPTHLPAYFARNLMNPFPPVRIRTFDLERTKAACSLGVSMKRLTEGKDWPADAAFRLMKDLSSLELMRLMKDLDSIPVHVKNNLRTGMALMTPILSQDLLMDYTPVPEALYQTCDSDACARGQLEKAREIWPAEALEEASAQRMRIYKRTFRGKKLPEKISVSDDTVNHFLHLISAEMFTAD